METAKAQDLTIECLVHDLNNVFQTLIEAADLLAADPRWEPLAGTLFRTVERGRGIVESLNATAHDPIDVSDMVAGAIQFARDFASTVHGREIHFAAQVEPGLVLNGRRYAWERVLINLLLNAAQALPPGGRVEIRAERRHGQVELEIADNGPGIPEDVLPHIFQPRFSTTASRGLGLHIVETIVAEHDGEVLAANREDGQGARFTIRVPAERVRRASA
jgi:signal transduction histidine kinase